MFGLCKMQGSSAPSFVSRSTSRYCHVIEGAEVIDTLCPISKVTGFHENPLSLLSRVLDPAKARLVDSIMQPIPALRDEGNNISDDDALDMVMDRLSTGSRSEDALMRQKLESMLDVLLPSQREAVEGAIQFNEGDQSSAESESNS